MKIIGIDLGSTTVKAVEIDSAFGRYEVQEYHEQPIESGSAPAQAASKLLLSLPKTPDRVVMSLKTRQVTFRNLQLPTRDKKAIQTGVAFELEDELPFSIENAAFDYSIISQSKTAGTQAHVAATLKKNIASALSDWTDTGIDPDLVTTEAWAYRTLLNRVLSPQEQESPVLLVQMGHERTTLYVHWRGIPILARDLPWGGADLTLAISQKYQISLEQAESAKLDHGFVIPPAQKQQVTPEQIEFSNALSQPIERLISELRQIELTTKNLTNFTLQQIYTSGGTSMLPGLNQVLEQLLKSPVRPLAALSSIATSGVSYSEGADAKFLLASSLALCMVGSDRSTAINFRKGMFAKQGRTRELNMATLRKPLLAFAAIFICFLSSMFVQSSFYSSQIKDTNSHLERSIRGFFGYLSNSAIHTYLSNISLLRHRVSSRLNHARELAKIGGPNQKDPLNFLRSVSSSIPKNLVVDMTHFEVGAAEKSYFSSGQPKVALTFVVQQPQVVDQLTSVLKTEIAGLSKSKIEQFQAPAGGGKRWKVTFQGTATKSSLEK